jgi:hypothetical protein
MAKKRNPNQKISLPPMFQGENPEEQRNEGSCPGRDLCSYLSDMFKAWDDHRRVDIVPVWTLAWNNFNSVPTSDGAITSTDMLTQVNRGKKAWRSRSFHPLTEQKVMAGTSQIDDVLFRSDSFPYDFSTSPITDTGMPGITFDSGDEGATPEMQEKLAMEKETKAKMRRMKLKVDDQLAESKAIDHGRAAVFFATLYGTAVMEAPVVVRRTRNFWKNGKLKQKVEDVPEIRALDVWDIWPDPNCDGDVQKGRGVFHRQTLSLADLQALYRLVFPKRSEQGVSAGEEDFQYEYIQENFKALLNMAREKGRKASDGGSPMTERAEDRPWLSRVSASAAYPKDNYDLFKFSGIVPNEYLVGLVEGVKDDGEYSEVIVHFCRGLAIKVSLNTFPMQRRPYYIIPFTKIPGSPWGRGVGQKLFDYQENINRLVRMYIDNKRLSGNLMTAIDKSKLKKGETLEIYPGRNWEFEQGFGDGDVRKLIQSVALADVTGGVLEAIQMMMDWADQASGIPRILEGGNDAKTNATAYAENQRIIAASKQLGLVLKNFDLYGWVPIVEALYNWNMEFSEDKDIKGDFAVVATGFASFENKNMKKLDLERMLIMSQQNPILGARIKAAPLLEDWFQTSGLKVDRYLYSENEASVRDQQQQQEMLQQQQALMQLQQAQVDREHAAELELTRAKAEFSGQVRVQLEQMKNEIKMATDRMKTDSQKLIAAAKMEVDLKKQEGAREKTNGNQGRKPGAFGGGKK